MLLGVNALGIIAVLSKVTVTGTSLHRYVSHYLFVKLLTVMLDFKNEYRQSLKEPLHIQIW
jgi:hypothetical protein